MSRNEHALEPESVFSRCVSSRYGFPEALRRLKVAIGDEALWVIHEIDTQALLAKEGHAIPPLRQLLFFHPRYMIRLLAGTPDALVNAPLRVLLREDPQGGVWVQHPRLPATLGPGAELDQLAQELRGIYDRVLEAACR